MMNVGNAEILQIVEAVSREKGISREHLIAAMEQAVQVAGKKKYGHDHNIRAEISRKNGEIKLSKILKVVDVVEDYFTEISLQDALDKDPNVKIGEEIVEPLPPIDLGRVAAIAAKHIIVQKVNEAEREKQYHDFKDKKGEILAGIVKRVDFGNIVVDLGRAEATIRKDQAIRTENYKINDRIKAYVQDVRLETNGPQIFLSRTDNGMLVKLFELEVPEINSHVIQIKGVARDPGFRSKIAVFAPDSSIDAVGSCVGMRGNRIKAIINELSGEKVDVVLWSNNPAQFVINAMAPAQITKIVMDEVKGRVEVVVPEDQLSLAIGRKGQSVRLASKLTGWGIDVLTEEQEVAKRAEEVASVTNLFVQLLNIDEDIALLLSKSGISSVEQLAQAELEFLNAIDGFDEKISLELQNRAVAYINEKNESIIEKLESLGVEQELIDILDVSPESILSLAEYGVKTIEDLGEMTLKEFKDLVPNANFADSDIELLIKTAKQQSE